VTAESPKESGLLSAPQSSAEAVVAAYQNDYSRLEADWASIEAKAQGTLAVAGIFVGFALGYTKDLQASASKTIKGLLIAVIGLLLLGVGSAATALFVRSRRLPPDASFQEKLATDWFALDTSERESYRPFLTENLRIAWAFVVKEQAENNNKKANRVLVAQILLLAAVSLTGLLAVVKILQK
jgi:hypothetical protein